MRRENMWQEVEMHEGGDTYKMRVPDGYDETSTGWLYRTREWDQTAMDGQTVSVALAFVPDK